MSFLSPDDDDDDACSAIDELFSAAALVIPGFGGFVAFENIVRRYSSILFPKHDSGQSQFGGIWMTWGLGVVSLFFKFATWTFAKRTHNRSGSA
jgi:hypothetical protein